MTTPGSQEAWIAFTQDLLDVTQQQAAIIEKLRAQLAAMRVVHAIALQQARKPKGH